MNIGRGRQESKTFWRTDNRCENNTVKLKPFCVPERDGLPDIISHIMLGRLVDRAQPDRVDAELLQVRDF